MVSEVDSEQLIIDRTVFRHNEDNNVEDIPCLMQFPSVIRDCLIKHRLVFANNLSAERKIKCEPLQLMLKPCVELPTKCRRAWLTAHHWRPRVKAIFEKMHSAGVLVQADNMTPVVSASFFVKKPHGNGIRFVTDYTGVNKALERPPHHFLAPEEVWQRVTAGSKYFIAGDLAAGYWQCKLDEKSSLLSMCLTEFENSASRASPWEYGRLVISLTKPPTGSLRG